MASGESFVFISYTGVDEPWATWVATVLESAGLTARVQVWDSPPGTNFVEWMNAQLAGARWTVALYSEAYFASQWCTAEWTASLARQTLLPIRLEPVEPPAVLRMITWVDLFDLDEGRAKERLLYAVGVQVMPRLATFPGKTTGQAWPPAMTGDVRHETNIVINGASGDDLTEAIKLLGSDSRHARLGAIRLLRLVVASHPGEQRLVVEVLSSFVCEQVRTLKGITGYGMPETVIESDVQAALTTLGQFPVQSGLIRADLRGCWLFGANLRDLNFSHADLRGVDFTRAQLHNTDFTGARLDGAELAEASGLEGDQVCAASGDYETHLPDYVERPSSWPPYSPRPDFWRTGFTRS